MTSAFISVLNMSLTASFVAVGVMLIRIPLKKAPKIFSYALWAIVLFKLLCPFTFETTFSLNPVKAEPVPQNIIYSQAPIIDSGLPLVDHSLYQVITNNVPPATPSASVNPLQDMMFVFSLIWLIGIALLLTYALVSYYSLKRRLRFAIPLRKNIYESDRIKTAFVLGFVRPKIYLPLGLSETELDYILKHEQTHIKRKDHLIKLIAFLALSIHWFNPVIWLSYILAMRDMELSCDESVLKIYGSDIRRDYANSLLAFSARQNGLVSPLSFGETGVKSRIINVLNYRKPAMWISVLAIAAIIAAAVFLLPNSSPGKERDIGQEIEEDSTEVLHESSGIEPISDDSTPNELFAGITADGALRGEMYDLAIKYRFDYVPFFAEGYPPQSSAEYLFWAFAINLHNWGEDKGTMSKAYVEDVINKHFSVKNISHQPLQRGWNFDGENYIAVPQGLKDEPIYVLTSLKTSTQNGKTIYEAEMSYCNLASAYLPTEEERAQIREGIISGDYSLLQVLQKETFTYYFNDAGEPVFIAHIMTDRPELKWYYQVFRNDPGFLVLGSGTGEISDYQMATYAVLRMDNYSYENGNTKEEYNAITHKYFGRNIKNFDNGATETIPGTDRIRATGWSFDSSMFVTPKNIWSNGDATLTGDFYCVNIPDSYLVDFEEVEEALFSGDISFFMEADLPITLKRVVYEVLFDENGKPYFRYHSVKNLEENVKSVVLYSK